MDEKKPSQLLITFEDSNSIRFEAKVQNISPEQLLFLGDYLKWYAKRLLESTVQSQDSLSQVLVPKMSVGKPQGNPLRSGLIRGA